MWFLPTRRRLGQLQAMLDQCVATGMTTPGRILVQDDEFEELYDGYANLRLPVGWEVSAVSAEGMAAKVQWAYATGLHGSAQWIGVLTDDQYPITANWDVRLISGLRGWNIVSSDDMDQAPKRMEGATVWSRGLVDAIGYLAPPGLRHLFFDDVQERIGKETGCLTWMMDVKVAHRPVTYSGQRDAAVDAIHSFRDADEGRYRTWVANEFAAACEAVMRCAESVGVRVDRPDLKGVSLYLTTPSGAGMYDRRYVRSLMQTVDVVRAAGGVIDWGEMPYCADLSHARARILGAFLRSPHTHMLMVDDDMGWSPHDVLRLIGTKLDFVGGAGPKKMYPVRYCIYSKDELGRDVHGEYSEETATMEVTGIGTGFLMITRACAERMVASYPELKFDPGEGQSEWGLFDSVYLPTGMRLSDDFAFCWRWRKIGGKVHVMPSIRLAHVGAHCFEGSLLDAMLAEPVPVQQAAE